MTNVRLKNGAPDIGVIICYFGAFPWYFEYFIHSCRYNKTVDFYIITDNDVADKYPSDNIRFITMTLDELNDLVSSKLGVKTCITTGYKLCDFKPMYGLIFDDLLRQYKYWAQSDIDVIYGDLRYFLDELISADYDYISVRHDFTTGCFSVFKNIPLVNNLFWRSKDIGKVLSSETHYCFDECNFVQQLLTDGKEIWDINTEIYSYTHIIKEAERSQEIKPHFDFILLEGVTGKIRFDHGKLIYNNQFEAILYHLYELKKVYKPKSAPKDIPGKFSISPTRIYFHVI